MGLFPHPQIAIEFGEQQIWGIYKITLTGLGKYSAGFDNIFRNSIPCCVVLCDVIFIRGVSLL